MSGLCDTCKTKIRCIAPAGGVVQCSFYEQNRKDRWFELFGTPERAAETAWRLLMCHITTRCDECPMEDGCDISTDAECDDGKAALLEWLRGDAE